MLRNDPLLTFLWINMKYISSDVNEFKESLMPLEKRKEAVNNVTSMHSALKFISRSLLPKLIFLIGIVGGGVELGPLDTAATNRPIVPAPGNYNDGEICGIIGRGNRSTRRKPAPMPLCPPQTPHVARTRTSLLANKVPSYTGELNI
jgi:hypothetical protein